MKRLKELKKDYEKYLIETTLKNTDGDIERASKLLKIGKSTLRYKIKKYEISAERRNK